MGAQKLQAAASGLQILQIDEGHHYEIEDESSLPFRHIKNLGSGRSGIVDKIVHTKTNSVYARKTFAVRSGEWDRVREDFRREIGITRRLARNRHIVRLVASYSTPDGPAVILEPAADGGTLSGFLACFVSTDDETVKASLRNALYRAYGCLANGLAFMHQHKIRHRDIKPENILLHSGSVLFTDFGISRDYSDQTRATTEGKPDFYTPQYCAPEVRWWDRRTWKSDVFSLGCVFLVMYTAAWPNKDVEVIATTSWFHERLDELEEIIKGFSHDVEVVECMKGMLREEERRRPSAAETAQILREKENRYFCEQCRGELPRTNHTEDIFTSNPASSSITMCDDDMPHLSSSTNYGNDSLSDITELEQSKGALYIDTTKTLEIRQDYSELETNYSQSVVRYSSTTGPQATYADSRLESRLSRTPNENMNAINNSTRLASADYLPSFKDRLIQNHSRLKRYGVHSRKIVRTIQNTSDSNDHRETVIHEDHIYEWAAHYLGVGFRLHKRKLYGNVLPSLSTYPIVSEFDDFQWSLVQRGTIEDIQSAFATHKLHPFVHTKDGDNLYSIALLARRLDVCHLLYSYGVRQSLMGSSHLEDLTYACVNLPTREVTGIFHFVLDSLETRPDDETLWPKLQHMLTWPRETLLWLWQHAPSYGLDVPTINEFCLRMTLRHLGTCSLTERHEVEKLLLQYLTPALISRIKNHDILLLDDLFSSFGEEPPHVTSPEQAAWDLGAIWLTTLSRCDIDISAYLAHEMEAHSDGLVLTLLPEHFVWARDYVDVERHFAWAYSEEKGYSVGWRFPEDSPGELVVDEFIELAGVSKVEEWPFAEGRKPRARIEELPGAWID